MSTKKKGKKQSSYSTWLILLACALLAVLLSVFVPSHFNSDKRAQTPAAPSVSDPTPHLSNLPSTVYEAGEYPIPCVASLSSLNRCFRVVQDNFLSSSEVLSLLHLFNTSLSLTGGGSGPVSVIDFHSGAISKGSAFVDLIAVMRHTQRVFNRSDLLIYKQTVERIAELVRKEVVNIQDKENKNSVYLTTPSFFSRINSSVPLTTHDEYFHPHNDKLQYGSFVVTALVYLNTYEQDFKGGEFVFLNRKSSTNEETVSLSKVLPFPGRLLLFTSSEENIHYVSRVLSGTRFALTIAFTMDEKKAVKDFLQRAFEIAED